MPTADEILELAGGTVSADSILQAAQNAVTEKPREQQNFFERVGSALGERGGQFDEIMQASAADEQGVVESGLQIAGKVGAGTVLDVLGELAVSAGRGIKNITPDVIEEHVAEGFKIASEGIDESTDAGLVLGPLKFFTEKGVENYPEFAQKHPRAARNIEAITNAAILATPTGATSRPVSGPLGQTIIRSGQASEQKALKSFIDDLVTPKQTLKERTKQVSRTTEVGPLRSKEVKLSSQQAKSAEVLNTIEGVTPKKTIQGNYNAIAAEVTKEANALSNRLRALGPNGRYQFSDLSEVSRKVYAELQSNPVLVGDAAKSADRVITKAFQLAADEEKTLAGLLNVRRELDNWVLKHKPKAFDDGAANAMTTAARTVRREINEFIERRATGVEVKESLSRQSAMLRAMDDIAVKAANEPKSIVARAINNAVKIIPVRNELVAALGLMFGMGGLGAASYFLPGLQKAGIAGAIVYGTSKAVMAPATRKALGNLIATTEKAIQKSADPGTLQLLRADRAALLQLMKDTEE